MLPYIVKDIFPAETDRRVEDGRLVFGASEEDRLSCQVLGQSVGAEVEAQDGQARVQQDPQTVEDVTIRPKVYHPCTNIRAKVIVSQSNVEMFFLVDVWERG